eukprot:5148241-Pleurochrysis_carterae.AAC.1
MGDDDEVHNASLPGSMAVNESNVACSFRVLSTRCGHDSFSFRAQMGTLVSKEANVSLFTVCLPSCDAKSHLIYTLSSCDWLTRKHEVIWAWNASGMCSPERSLPLPSGAFVPCMTALPIQTAHQVLNAVLASILCVLGIVCIGYVLFRSSFKRISMDVPCQLRLISLCGVVLVAIRMLLSLGVISDVRCNWRSIWLSYTLMYAPLVVKLAHLWRITKNRSLKHIRLERMKTVVPILIYACTQFLVSQLLKALYHTEVKKNSIKLPAGREYLYPTCNDSESLDIWLLLAQNIFVVCSCLYFTHGATGTESGAVRLEVQWARSAVLTLFACSVLLFPLPLIAHYKQLFVLAEFFTLVTDFIIGVAVCLAVAVPAWFNTKTVPGSSGKWRQNPEQERKSVPVGAMTYIEMEKH